MKSKKIDTSNNQKKPEGNSLVTTIISIAFTLLSICYTLTWGLLFVIFIEKNKYAPLCKNLKSWGRALYIIQISSSVIHLVASAIQIVASYRNVDSALPKIMMGCKGFLNCVLGFIMLIGINVVYFQTKDIKNCGKLQKLTLGYIICEWMIMGGFVICVCFVCSVSIICKKMKKNIRDEEDISDDENEI